MLLLFFSADNRANVFRRQTRDTIIIIHKLQPEVSFAASTCGLLSRFADFCASASSRISPPKAEVHIEEPLKAVA